MEMSTCDEPRPPNGPSPIATASGQSEYGFAEKVVEGISLSINSIVIRISAKAFNASFELSQLQVYSVNTSWVQSDLRFTRIQDPTRGEILTFKEVSWQMIRIEADAIQSGDHEVLSAPIRLITNQSKIRVTLKRRAKDCYVVASKLILILDDLLWVLTDSQLKAMVQYAKSLSEAMEKSAQQRKSMASENTEVAAAPPTAQQVRAQQSSAADQNATMARLFSAYDVCETSHHLQITHLDLHICDDIHAKDRVINKKITGGAMQLSFSSISLDYYPFHRAGESCQHWMHYSEAAKAREGWARNLLEEFRTNVDLLKTALKDHQSTSGQSQGSPQHGKISTSSSSSFSPPPTPRTQLMSSSFVLRMADFSIYQVSTADQRRSSPKAMISCNKKSLYLPQEMPAIHAELTEYYFPDGKDYPIPCPNLYVQLNALQLVVDPRSLVWLNLFALDLRQSLEQFMQTYKLDDSQKPDEHIDIRVDGLMLKLVIPAELEPGAPPDLPRQLSVQTSEMVATNTRHSPSCSRSSLEALLQSFQEESFFSSSTSSSSTSSSSSFHPLFPRSPDAFPVLHPVFQRHAHERDTRLHEVYRGQVAPSLSSDALKTPAATDVWAVSCSQFWADFEGRARSGSGSGRGGRPTPFVDSFPLALWVCQPARHAQHLQRLKRSATSDLPATPTPSDPAAAGAGSEQARMHRKRMLKEYYSVEVASASGISTATLSPSNGLRKPHSLDSLGAGGLQSSSSLSSSSSSSSSSSPSSSSSAQPDLQVLVQVQKALSAQLNHLQYMFLLRLQRTMKQLQQTLQQDLERNRSSSSGSSSSATQRQHRKQEQEASPFSVCVGVLLKSAEVSLLLKPVPSPNPPSTGAASPLGSDLSPSESRGTLDPSADGGEGTEGAPAGGASSSKAPCPVEQLLCASAADGGGMPAPLLPPPPTPPQPASAFSSSSFTSSSASPAGRKGSLEERRTGVISTTTTTTAVRRSSAEERREGAVAGGGMGPVLEGQGGEAQGGKAQQGEPSADRLLPPDPLSDPLSRDWNSDNKGAGSGNRMPQSMSSGRLMKDRSQSSFAVSYKNMKKSPSLQSLDNISIDSYLLEDGDNYSLLERDDVSMSGFKDALSEHSTAESASEVLVPSADGAVSPDAVSATSQSIDEPTKDMVSVLVLKVNSVCGSLDMRGENTAVALEVGQVRPNQLGNVSLRQFLSNRSLGSGSAVSSSQSGSGAEVQVRLESGPSAAAHSPLAEHNGFLQCRLHALSADLLMSTLQNLGHFVEDSSEAQVLPMEISVRDVHVNLKDDGPRDNASEPEPTPIALHVDNLLIHRRDDGSFSIGLDKTAEPPPPPKAAPLIDSRLSAVPEVPVCVPVCVPSEPKATQTNPLSPTNYAPSSREKMLIEENECLKLELSRAKMALAEAQMEKDSLLHHMKNLRLASGAGNS
ncbi:hypothetical protein ACEWY4_027689 [Coilia grayii]|uniref:UHRF1-binding protein 1-like n=1 Tax=Coilia grayii TaxID=363190 RepID=A0ABD1IPE8_9TELE